MPPDLLEPLRRIDAPLRRLLPAVAPYVVKLVLPEFGLGHRVRRRFPFVLG